MLTAVVLVCSLNSTPNLSDCTADNAMSVTFAEPSQSFAICGLNGQAALARTELVGSDEAVKIVCTRKRG